MNKNVCKLCRRFEEDVYKRPNYWMCAKELVSMYSDVIPGHSYFTGYNFHPISAELPMPEWCERPLEQTILSPEDTVNIEPDSNIVYDGNTLSDILYSSRLNTIGSTVI